MIGILSIGNSFSQDATAYLEELAACGGVEAEVVNLYIGGCSLATHWHNAQNDLAAYDYQRKGVGTGRRASIREALQERDWNVVTLQQVSGDSGLWQTYEPYLGEMSEYVKKYAAGAKQMIHETWAYETDSANQAFEKYGKNQQTMYMALRTAYRKAAAAVGAGWIPCGDAIQALRALPEFDYPRGGLSLCRDGSHLNLVYGRYAAAAVWYEAVMKRNILENTFAPHGDLPADENLLRLIARTVHGVCSRPEPPEA